MKLPKQNLLIFSLILCSIFHGLSHKAFGNDIRSGVDSDTALRITIDCIQAASGIVVNEGSRANSKKGGRTREELLFSKISPEDTLKQAGITDDYRLNALKNYIVRNREFGVPSLWGQNREVVPYQIQNYIIPFAALKKINLETPVSEVAAAIKNNAGLPFLPVTKATSIVAGCRCKFRTCVKTSDCGSNPKCNSTSNYIKDELIIEEDKLVACLKQGLNSAFIEDPTGETYRYRISKFTSDDYEKNIGAWNYENLIKRLSEDAFVPATRDFVPTRIVVDTLIALTNAQPPQKPLFTLSELFEKAFPNKPGTTRQDNKVFSESNSLQSLRLDSELVKQKLIDISGQTENYTYSYQITNNKKPFEQFSKEELIKIEPKTTVGGLIKIIDELLKKREEANKEAVK